MSLATQTPPTRDLVNHPPHYETGIECIDAIEAALGEEGFRAYLRGNIIKYLWRCERKHLNPVDDLKKSRWYLDKLIASYTT